ncbi:MAG TPA: D-cysteine desulfhydrase family protein, partial [Candidatus Avipropionibacterium avicola]|nr:D-cysteine desulfhydrase family protein [Candidatus Avipropionibacterium avicola]
MNGTQRARAALAALPRVRLAELPTPLTECARLSEILAGPRILVKRDDCTGLALGGNKVRQHEYVLGDALAGGADCLVQGAAAQSNHSRQLAAAGARLGIETHLLPKVDDPEAPIQGNHLLDHLLGAVIHPIRSTDSTIAAKESLARRLREQGRHPYVMGMGAQRALVLAAVAYVGAVLELADQLDRAPTAIVTTSQGSTQAGLVLGCRLLGWDTQVVGICPMPPDHEAWNAPTAIAGMASEAAALLGEDLAPQDFPIELRQEFVGPGYGIGSPEGREAMALLGRTEGMLLDPVYTAKGFAGLLADVRAGRWGPGDDVVFCHTGGLPGLFAQPDEVLAAATPP